MYTSDIPLIFGGSTKTSCDLKFIQDEIRSFWRIFPPVQRSPHDSSWETMDE